MPYPIWVVAFKDGSASIGVKHLGRNWQRDYISQIDDVEQIYGSQVPFRVVAKTPHGYRLMTKTDAKQRGYRYRSL